MVALPLQQSNIIPFPVSEPVQGKSQEWYTPSVYVEAARRVLGTIDLDPASCERANRTVKATAFYSREENGLALPWYGRVWLNPPYGSTDGASNIGTFTRRLVTEYQSGNVNAAILLATTKTGSSWFTDLWNYLICFVDHDINFDCLVKNKNRYNGKATHIHGSIFVYLGTNEQAFITEFSRFGHIAKSIAGPRREVEQPHLWTGVQS